MSAVLVPSEDQVLLASVPLSQCLDTRPLRLVADRPMLMTHPVRPLLAATGSHRGRATLSYRVKAGVGACRTTTRYVRSAPRAEVGLGRVASDDASLVGHLRLSSAHGPRHAARVPRRRPQLSWPTVDCQVILGQQDDAVVVTRANCSLRDPMAPALAGRPRAPLSHITAPSRGRAVPPRRLGPARSHFDALQQHSPKGI